MVSIALFCLFNSYPATGQTLSSPYLGRQFLVALPDTVRNDQGTIQAGFNISPELILFSIEETEVSITGPAGSRTLTLRPDASATVRFFDFFSPATTPYVDRVGVPVGKSLEVVSTEPIWMYCRFVSPFGTEMFSPRLLNIGVWSIELRRCGMIPC